MRFFIAQSPRKRPDRGQIGIELDASEAEAIFRVLDTGPGISPEHRDRIFRPFWQGSGATTPGVGLGLAITRGIIEAHGGTIHVENPPSGGAMFQFAVPLDGSEGHSASFDIGRAPG